MNKNVRMLIKLTNNIYRCTQVYVDKRLEKFNLSTGSYPYLLVLSKYEGISQNDISRELNVDKAMSARTVKKLINLGYIEKEENQEDVRAYKLYLTDKGREVIPEIFKIIDEWTEILVQGNEEDKIKASIEFLESVLENGIRYRRDQCERMKSVE